VPVGRTRGAAAALAAIMLLVAATAASGCGIVDTPDANLANNPVVAATKSSVVTIRALAPSCQKELEGSGFVVSDHTVMSNAHVVAGSNSVTVQDTDGNSHDATVVSYDPAVDIAILDVPGLPAPPLAFANAPAATGTDALVMGFPDAGSFEATPARIRKVVELDGPDIYRTTTVTRQVYTISGTVRQGDSGGPLLDLNGQVLGVVFGEAVDHPDTGFVMTAEQVSRELQKIGKTTAVATGSCIS
jgi:S1-C subfamily serine protease